MPGLKFRHRSFSRYADYNHAHSEMTLESIAARQSRVWVTRVILVRSPERPLIP